MKSEDIEYLEDLDDIDRSELARLIHVVHAYNRNLAKAFIRMGPDFSASARDLAGVPLLHEIVKKRNIEILRLSLDHGGKDAIDTTDHIGNTPLVYAASSGDMESVKLLVEAGASVSKINMAGRSARVHALGHGHQDIAEFLETVEEEQKV